MSKTFFPPVNLDAVRKNQSFNSIFVKSKFALLNFEWFILFKVNVF